ncbi:MAG TPA: cytochrome c peroxidase, partial [Bacteroidia bacterium]|nr:cytochrome c peroxidase [Bacteroidia bacterium]
MKKNFIVLLVVTVIVLAFRAGSSLVTWPEYFPEPVYDFKASPLTGDKIELGRQLFYDPVLSIDSSTSCASCHSPYNAFAHVDHSLSHGVHDSIGTRNAPALFNLAWQKQFMWDGAINHIEVQPLAPINSATEMHENIAHVVVKLQRSRFYPQMFYKAFGDSLITGQNVLLALAQFQLTLVSANSKYDSVTQHTATFNAQEEKGYALFKAHCNVCHREPLFSTYEYARNGLSPDPALNDLGRFNITRAAKDSFLFKIPSLRNVGYSYPYMHDGRFYTLFQVISHYSEGTTGKEYIAGPLKLNKGFAISEKLDLVAFLLT